MHLFFIRHGETEHNVAGLLAGVSDSRLTNHGVLQTQKLGKYLTAHRNLRFTRIYASDLQRAYMTAEELQKHQTVQWAEDSVPEVVRLGVLREQDFGSLELVPWASARAQHALDPRVPNPADPSFRPQESAESMASRAELFITDFILPLIVSSLENEQDSAQECVAVVSHGLFLSKLWQSFLSNFNAGEVTVGPDIEVLSYGRPLAYLPSWTNTAFLEMTIRPSTVATAAEISTGERTATDPNLASPLGGCSMTIHVVNGKDHLLDLKRSRGGIGSSPHDVRQKSLDGFFKHPKEDDSKHGSGS